MAERLIPLQTVDFDREVYMIMGLPVDVLTISQAFHTVQRAALSRTRCFLSTPNLNFLVNACKNSAFRQSLIDSDLVVADGISLIIAARLLGVPLKGRVAGSDLMDRLMKTGLVDRAARVYFLGGRPGVAEMACHKASLPSSRLFGAGWNSLGHGEPDAVRDEQVVADINASKPDFLIVALGAVRGQAWIQHNKSKLDAPVISHLGAVINFIAGKVIRAPTWMQKMGLEWIWRIVQEPALIRRYWRDGLTYLQILHTHVIPLRAEMWTWRSRLADLPPLRIQVSRDLVSATTIHLSGRAGGADISVLRNTIKQLATAQSGSIQINLRECAYVDASFLGLLALLLKHQRANNQELRIQEPSEVVRRLFRLHQADYLLE